MSTIRETQSSNYLNNQTSPESIEGGVDLGEIKNILLRKFPLIVGCTLAVTSLALLKVMTTPADYVGEFELLSEPVNIETKVTSSNEDSRKTREEITEVELDEVQLKILKSPQLILRISESLQKQYPGISYQEITAGLTIDIILGSQEEQNILKVSYQNPDKQKVTDILHALNKTYQEYSVEKRLSGVKRGIAFLDRQIPQVAQQTKEIESKIAQLRTEYNFNNPDSSLTEITARINQLSKRREENTIQLKELKLTLSNLDRELGIQPARSTTAIELATPRYLELLSKMRELDVEISQQSNIFADNSEVIQALKQDKQKLNLLIREAGADIRHKLTNQIAVLDNQQQSIANEIENLRLQLGQWSAISGDYRSLQHQLSIANRKLNEFTSQKDALQIDAAQQKSPWQLLTPVSEPQINNMSTANYLLLGSTLGLILGSGAALFLEKHQKIIYTAAKVEEITNLPILATIPYSPKIKRLSLPQATSVNEQAKSFSASLAQLPNSSALSVGFSNSSIESFRSFAVNLGLSSFSANSALGNPNNNLKSIVVTSAIPREGKSTMALNLARASASMGKRVLLVDTDLRSADRLTNNLGFNSQPGLIDILREESPESAQEYVQQLPSERDLYLLTSGLSESVENSAALDFGFLLASQKMRNLMGQLQSSFDLVIYDLCSIIGFADVNLLAAQTDGVVVVTGLGRIQTVAFTEALNQLKLCNAPVLGIAVNKVVNKG